MSWAGAVGQSRPFLRFAYSGYRLLVTLPPGATQPGAHSKPPATRATSPGRCGRRCAAWGVEWRNAATAGEIEG